MSKIQTMLGEMVRRMDDFAKIVREHESTYCKKEDVIRDMAHIEKQMEAVWKRLDNPHACPNAK